MWLKKYFDLERQCRNLTRMVSHQSILIHQHEVEILALRAQLSEKTNQPMLEHYEYIKRRMKIMERSFKREDLDTIDRHLKESKTDP